MKKINEIIIEVVAKISNWFYEKDKELINANTPYQKTSTLEEPAPIDFNLYSKVVFNTNTNIRLLEETKRYMEKDHDQVMFYIKDCLNFAKLQTLQGIRPNNELFIPWSPRYLKIRNFARAKICRYHPNELFNILKLFEYLYPENKRIKDHLNMYFNKHEEIL